MPWSGSILSRTDPHYETRKHSTQVALHRTSFNNVLCQCITMIRRKFIVHRVWDATGIKNSTATVLVRNCRWFFWENSCFVWVATRHTFAHCTFRHRSSEMHWSSTLIVYWRALVQRSLIKKDSKETSKITLLNNKDIGVCLSNESYWSKNGVGGHSTKIFGHVQVFNILFLVIFIVLS